MEVTFEGAALVEPLEGRGVEVGIPLMEDGLEPFLLAFLNLGEAVYLAHAGLVVMLLLAMDLLGEDAAGDFLQLPGVVSEVPVMGFHGVHGVVKEVLKELAVRILA